MTEKTDQQKIDDTMQRPSIQERIAAALERIATALEEQR